MGPDPPLASASLLYSGVNGLDTRLPFSQSQSSSSATRTSSVFEPESSQPQAVLRQSPSNRTGQGFPSVQLLQLSSEDLASSHLAETIFCTVFHLYYSTHPILTSRPVLRVRTDLPAPLGLGSSQSTACKSSRRLFLTSRILGRSLRLLSASSQFQRVFETIESFRYLCPSSPLSR